MIFIHGCFWHQHPGCSKSRRPSSNIAYWNRKLDENISRDRAKTNELEKEGWCVFIVWQCEIGNKAFKDYLFKELVTRILHHDSLRNNRHGRPGQFNGHGGQRRHHRFGHSFRLGPLFGYDCKDNGICRSYHNFNLSALRTFGS